MKNDYLSRSELLKKIKAMDIPAAIQKGRELREEGYRLISHPIWSDSVEIPGGEQFSEARLRVRHGMVDDKEPLKKGFEYLMLCDMALKKTSEKERGYEL